MQYDSDWISLLIESTGVVHCKVVELVMSDDCSTSASDSFNSLSYKHSMMVTDRSCPEMLTDEDFTGLHVADLDHVQEVQDVDPVQ